jgi:hypothetical protein
VGARSNQQFCSNACVNRGRKQAPRKTKPPAIYPVPTRKTKMQSYPGPTRYILLEKGNGFVVWDTEHDKPASGSLDFHAAWERAFSLECLYGTRANLHSAAA